MILHIPKDDRTTIVELMSLAEASRAKIVEALRQAKPTLRPGELAKSVSEHAEVDPDKLARYFAVLGAMLSTQAHLNLTLDKTLDAVRESLVTDEPGTAFTSDVLNRFKTFASACLGLDSALGILAKANDVLMDNERLFSSARILTDIRPIFPSDKVANPLGGVIVHNLRISYVARSRHQETAVYFVLDAEDLRTLKETIERALAKEENLVKEYTQTMKLMVS